MSRFKTELCNNLQELGICKYGDRCHYAHGAHELRPVSRRHPKYRTEKCKNFELNGWCPFGPRCSYVHSKPDLETMCADLDRVCNYTKAPRPDSEDDDDHSSFFARTESSLSICDYNGVGQALTDENIENQFVKDTTGPLTSRSQAKQQSRDKVLSNQNQQPISSTKLEDRSFFTNIENRTPIFNSVLSSIKTKNSAIEDVSSQAIISAPPKAIRAPLGQNSCNVLAPASPLSIQPQINSTRLKHNLTQVNEPIDCNMSANSGAYNKVLTSFYGATSYESNKRLRTSSINSSSSNNAASNPFAINNPLSDILNRSNVINRRNPLQPRKQFYTRF